MAKRRKSKGKRRSGKRRAPKRRGRVRGHKFGIAESLGLTKAAYDVGMTPVSVFGGKSVAGSVIHVITHPSTDAVKFLVNAAVQATKEKGQPAVVGIIISNSDKLPFIGKLLAPSKHKVDRVVRKYTGMGL